MGKRFWSLLIAGLVALAVVVLAGAIVAGWTLVAPVLVLAGVVAVSAVAFRVWAGSRPDAQDHGPVANQPTSTRPLGDTPEAHDEVIAHDIPKYNAAARHAAEHESGGDTRATIRGHRAGGAQGEGGPQAGRPDRVGDDEKQGARATGEGGESA